MIVPDGYSKDKSIMPEGVVITWGKDLVNARGGLEAFTRFFEDSMKSEESFWVQKSLHKPSFNNLLYVYIIINNSLLFRCSYAGYDTGYSNLGEGHSWSYSTAVEWPRIVMSAPLLKAPVERKLGGFQGFRYCTKLF